MARPPLSPRSAPQAWAGSALFVWAAAPLPTPRSPTELADGALYEPSADAWTVLPPPRW